MAGVCDGWSIIITVLKLTPDQGTRKRLGVDSTLEPKELYLYFKVSSIYNWHDRALCKNRKQAFKLEVYVYTRKHASAGRLHTRERRDSEGPLSK